MKTVLILGASGRFGKHAAEAFAASGWHVRRFSRQDDNLMTAARDADVIVNSWNPAYPDWAREVPAITQQVINAARATGATVLIPGNVYVFGADAPSIWSPQTPHAAKNKLGRIRIDMERAYRTSGVPTIVLRAGDFLDTEASGNWFDMIMAKSVSKGRFTYPGALDRTHAWAFLPDLARAAVALAERRATLATFEDVPFPGYTLTGARLAELVNSVSSVRVSRMSWWPIRLAAPVWRMGRHLLEMRYLWNKPHQLDASRFNELLPEFQHTPLTVAIRQALAFQVNPDKPMARPVLKHVPKRVV